MQALAFEPVRRTFAFLEQNIQENPHAEKINALRLAVSDRDGEQTIAIKVGHSGAANLRSTPPTFFRRTETINTIGSRALKEIKPDLAKAGYLDTARAIFYEVDVRWSNPDRLRHLLENHGFHHFIQSREGGHYDVLATRV